MKANNTLNISDLTNWINFQLSTIIEGVSAGYTLGNYNSVWIDRGATVFTVSLATGEEIEINSDNYATAEDIAKAIISALNKNTPSTSDTMNTETKTMNTTELINAVSAHLRNIVEQSYTVCAVNLTAPIVNAGAALGIVICGGAYDPDTETRVLYTEKC